MINAIMNSILIVFCTFALVGNFVNGEANYTIAFPKIIRPGTEYNVIISLKSSLNMAKIGCNIYLFNHNSNKTISGGETEFKRFEHFKVLSLSINSKLDGGDYFINCKGSGDNFYFDKYKPLTLRPKKLLYLVQTDKQIYKPDETILFRVLILTQYLKPARTDDIRDAKINIINPLNSTVKTLRLLSEDRAVKNEGENFEYLSGVTNDLELYLDNNAFKGKWKIQFENQGYLENQTFFVSDYISPLAFVNISLPSYITYNDPIINYNITALYTFGKYVNGLISVKLEKISECGEFTKKSSKPLKVYEENLNGEGQHFNSVNLANFLNAYCAETKFNISVKVNAKETGTNYENFAYFDVYKQDLRAELMSNRKYFHPGKTIEHQVKITDLHYKDVDDNILSGLICKATYTFSDNSHNDESIKPQKSNSIILCKIQSKAKHSKITIEIKNNPAITTGHTIFNKYTYKAFENCQGDYIQISKNEPLKPLNVKNIEEMDIVSNNPFEELIYFIMVRGDIVNSSRIEFGSPSLTHRLPIELTPQMVPEFWVLVFKRTSQNSLVSDSIKLVVSGTVHDQVEINIATPEVDAGQPVRVNIKAVRNSKVLILAVDEDMNYYKDKLVENDITPQRIEKKLAEYYGNEDSPDSFMQSGSHVITDLALQCGATYTTNKIQDDDEKIEEILKNQVILRKNLKSTWLFENVTINSQGNSKFKITALDSITTWKLTAFSLKEDHKLGITKIPSFVRVFRKFFLKMSLPATIRQGETFFFQITVFNYFNESLDVNLSMPNKSKKLVTKKTCDTNFTIKADNGIHSINCSIMTNEVGLFNLTSMVKATSKLSRKIFEDGEQRTFRVIYPGEIIKKSEMVFFDTLEQQMKSKTFSVNYPNGKINGSEYLIFTASSNIVNFDWRNQLEEAFKYKPVKYDFHIPEECCQQRVANSYPKVFFLDYFKKSKKFESNQLSEAIKNIEYTNGQLCKNPQQTGSFYLYKDNIQSNMWITAYSLKFLAIAGEYIGKQELFDNSRDTRNWLKNRRKSDGSYSEVEIAGSSPRAIFSTANPDVYMTSFVYIALNTYSDEKYARTEEFLSKSYSGLKDNLDKFSSCYALHLYKNESLPATNFKQCFQELMKLSININGSRYWETKDGKFDLHISAYGLLMLMENELHIEALEVFKFIISKQSAEGIFVGRVGEIRNSYLNIICTEALTKYISIIDVKKNSDINKLTLNFDDGINQPFIYKANEKDFQIFTGNAASKKVSLKSTGHGRALALVEYGWNELVSKTKISNIAVRVQKEHKSEEYYTINYCAKYKLDQALNNVILDANLPTGFKYHADKLIKFSSIIDTFKTTDDHTKFTAHLKLLNRTEICLAIPVVKAYEVRNGREVPVRVYAYYASNLKEDYTYNYKIV